ncbi:MAG TPA: ABC transporter permease subunit, partial [Pyrodictium sp.]|nr:ABC transporter permease subunit [Pyrodictium sp.]
ASVDPRYEAVARTLGYTRLQTLLRVTLPMARRGLLSAFLLAFIRALGEFGASVTLAGAIRFKTETLPIAIYLSISGGDLNLAVALMTVSILVAGVSVAALLALEKRE